MALFARSPAQTRKPGLAVSVRRLGATLVAMLHTRAELLAREFERERVRLARLLLLGVIALFFVTLGALAFTIFIIVLFWDSHRVVASGVLTLLYFGIGIGVALFAKREAGRSTRPFSHTLAELKKDRELFARHR